MTTLFHKWRALAPGESALLLRLMIVLPAVGAALRLIGVKRTYRLLGGETLPLDPDISENERALAKRLAELVGMAARHGAYKAACLPRSLVLTWLLRRRGVHARLCIGVARREHGIGAHAWVEVAGQVINDSPSVAGYYSEYRDLAGLLPRLHRIS